MKTLRILFFAAIILALATPLVWAQQAEQINTDQLAFFKNGKWYVHECIVATIPNFNSGQPVYVAYGQPQDTGGAVAGNGWFQHGTGDAQNYVMAKEGAYYTYQVPQEATAVPTLRMNVCQSPGRNARWAQIHEFAQQLGPVYVSTKATAAQKNAYFMKGSNMNGIELPTTGPPKKKSEAQS